MVNCFTYQNPWLKGSNWFIIILHGGIAIVLNHFKTDDIMWLIVVDNTQNYNAS